MTDVAVAEKESISGRQRIIKEIETRLGGGMTRVELVNDDYEFAVDQALRKYRQLAENSVEESYVVLPLQPEQFEYILPEEIIEVRSLFQRGISATSNSGTEFEPFSLAYTNAYLLQATRTGGLLTYELYHQFLETAAKLFGADINFTWDHRTHKLRLIRFPRDKNEVLIWCYLHVPEELLFKDRYAGIWIADWAKAEAQEILGTVRSKFAQYAGPQGGTTLNGDQLISNAQMAREELLTAMKNWEEGSSPLPFLIG